MSIKFLIAAAALATLAACAGPAPSQPGVTLINAARLQTLIETGQPQLAPTATGTMRGTLSLRNRSTAKLMIEGRATFVGERGEPVENPSAWQYVFLERDSGGTLQFLSMNNAARGVMVELREAAQ